MLDLSIRGARSTLGTGSMGPVRALRTPSPADPFRVHRTGPDVPDHGQRGGTLQGTNPPNALYDKWIARFSGTGTSRALADGRISMRGGHREHPASVTAAAGHRRRAGRGPGFGAVPRRRGLRLGPAVHRDRVRSRILRPRQLG